MNESRRKKTQDKTRDGASIERVHRPHKKMLQEFKTAKRMITAIPKEPNNIPPFNRKKLACNYRKRGTQKKR